CHRKFLRRSGFPEAVRHDFFFVLVSKYRGNKIPVQSFVSGPSASFEFGHSDISLEDILEIFVEGQIHLNAVVYQNRMGDKVIGDDAYAVKGFTFLSKCLREKKSQCVVYQ